MHYLITGHSGFKGSWLSLLLHKRGHRVSGISLNSEVNSIYKQDKFRKILENDIVCDIRDYKNLVNHFNHVNPEIIIHLAAQSLVRESYQDPLTTYETNVMGTINVLKASQSLKNLKTQIIITTDKVYKNSNKRTGYIESDPLGGHDPYSSSKAMADLATQSWLASFENVPTAIIRAGNVIGGGDKAKDRLIPDLIQSFDLGQKPYLRSPNAVRPWQFVLDCLNGYLLVVDSLLSGQSSSIWNIGPDYEYMRTVADVTKLAGQVWGNAAGWELDSSVQPHEDNFLLLNSDKARINLGWKEKLSFEESVEWTINWYKNVRNGADLFLETTKNIDKFDLINL